MFFAFQWNLWRRHLRDEGEIVLGNFSRIKVALIYHIDLPIVDPFKKRIVIIFKVRILRGLFHHLQIIVQKRT